MMTTQNSKDTTAAVPVAVDLKGGQGLSAFIHAANNAPVLSAEEEMGLARRYRDKNDLDAARQLVVSNLRYVIYAARGFLGYGLPLADLIQEGNIGLMKAVKRYDPDRQVRLISFAIHWVRAEIYDFILRNWRIVKVATTKAQRKLFFNLRKSKHHLGRLSDDEVGNLAEDFSVSKDTVREMESRLGGYDVAFNGPPASDDDEFTPSPENYLGDSRHDPARALSDAGEADLRSAQLKKSLQSLDPRSREIITSRWLAEDKATLHDLARKYQVSAERIRQIEQQAMKKMRQGFAA